MAAVAVDCGQGNGRGFLRQNIHVFLSVVAFCYENAVIQNELSYFYSVLFVVYPFQNCIKPGKGSW